MRIISGTHKGRRISVPKKLLVRPTTDRSKEGLFNILQHRLDFKSLHALDLFSGTGNISYEFASRGVAQVTAVDQNRDCMNFIKNKAIDLGLAIDSLQSDSFTFLKKNSTHYDIIFGDPPYNWEVEAYFNLIIEAKKSLNNSGLIILE
ncbi:MAG: 16S rRNA (guanine966-N2)-methyltransferase, partial [Flavobacteriaceae bacterium]